MTRTLKTLSAAGLVLSLFAIGPASAENAVTNFRGREFPAVISPSGQQRFYSNSQNNSYNDGGFFNYFFGNLNQRQSADINIDPGIDTGSGTPIYTYYADPLTALGRADLKVPEVKAPPVFSADGPDGPHPVMVALDQQGFQSPLTQAVFDRLQGRDSGVRVTKEQNAAIVDFYKKRDFAPLWTTPQGLTPKAHELLDLFSKAAEDGLEPRDYLPPALTGFDGGLKAASGQFDGLADAELGLSAMALRYAMVASGGRIVPDRLSGYEDMNPPVVEPAAAFDALAASSQPAAYLAGLEPTVPAYGQLKAALKPLLAVSDNVVVETPVDTGPIIHVGDSDERIPAIRARLIKLGHLAAPVAASITNSTSLASDQTSTISNSGRVTVTLTTSEGMKNTQVASTQDVSLPISQDGSMIASTGQDIIYNDTLHQAIMDFQTSAGLKADGVIGNRTIAALNAGLNANTAPVQKEKIKLAMERLRWLPRDFGHRYVLANLAAFELYVWDNGQQIWQSKVIDGKPNHQTTAFHDEIETVVFNPYWGVPQSIIIKEMLPYLRQDPGYLDQKGFEVTDNSGQRIPSSSIDWTQFTDKVPLNVRQPPGYDNALGVVKFLFPNKHSIYMHDTPSKPLFAKESRAYSHGCVRVQNPEHFAQILLGWSSNEVASAINSGQNREVNLPQKVPVYLTYFTAWPDAEGNVHFYKDVYGRDELMKTAEQTTDATLDAAIQ